MEEKDGFDWVPKQQREIRRQEIKDAAVGLVLMVIVGVAVVTGVIGG